jgi:hypothetical protein
MKGGFALIHKIWSDLKEKECCRSVVNVKRGKWRNVNKIGIRSSWIKKKREKEQNIKCLETKKDERFNILLQLSFYVLKIKSK